MSDDVTLIAHCYTLAMVDNMLADYEYSDDEAHNELLRCGFEPGEATALIADSRKHLAGNEEAL